jgi:TRAP-type uncharacterized transport system fused permease subunit
MSIRKLVSAAMIAAATLTTPAMAREGYVAHRHLAADANASTGSYVDGRACVPAPAVGAFATQPWDNGPPCEPTTTY